MVVFIFFSFFVFCLGGFICTSGDGVLWIFREVEVWFCVIYKGGVFFPGGLCILKSSW